MAIMRLLHCTHNLSGSAVKMYSGSEIRQEYGVLMGQVCLTVTVTGENQYNMKILNKVETIFCDREFTLFCVD